MFLQYLVQLNIITFQVKKDNGICITLKLGLNFPAIEYIQEVILQEAVEGKLHYYMALDLIA